MLSLMDLDLKMACMVRSLPFETRCARSLTLAITRRTSVNLLLLLVLIIRLVYLPTKQSLVDFELQIFGPGSECSDSVMKTCQNQRNLYLLAAWEHR